jgi:hypothetical protein
VQKQRDGKPKRKKRKNARKKGHGVLRGAAKVSEKKKLVAGK